MLRKTYLLFLLGTTMTTALFSTESRAATAVTIADSAQELKAIPQSILDLNIDHLTDTIKKMLSHGHTKRAMAIFLRLQETNPKKAYKLLDQAGEGALRLKILINLPPEALANLLKWIHQQKEAPHHDNKKRTRLGSHWGYLPADLSSFEKMLYLHDDSVRMLFNIDLIFWNDVGASVVFILYNAATLARVVCPYCCCCCCSQDISCWNACRNALSDIIFETKYAAIGLGIGSISDLIRQFSLNWYHAQHYINAKLSPSGFVSQNRLYMTKSAQCQHYILSLIKCEGEDDPMVCWDPLIAALNKLTAKEVVHILFGGENDKYAQWEMTRKPKSWSIILDLDEGTPFSPITSDDISEIIPYLTPETTAAILENTENYDTQKQYIYAIGCYKLQATKPHLGRKVLDSVVVYCGPTAFFPGSRGTRTLPRPEDNDVLQQRLNMSL